MWDREYFGDLKQPREASKNNPLRGATVERVSETLRAALLRFRDASDRETRPPSANEIVSDAEADRLFKLAEEAEKSGDEYLAQERFLDAALIVQSESTLHRTTTGFLDRASASYELEDLLEGALWYSKVRHPLRLPEFRSAVLALSGIHGPEFVIPTVFGEPKKRLERARLYAEQIRRRSELSKALAAKRKGLS